MMLYGSWCSVLSSSVGFHRIPVQCALVLCLIRSAAADLRVSSGVGEQAALPCNWTSRIGSVRDPSSLYLWWETPKESVFELMGDLRFEGPDHKGRLELESRSFEGGDCSLLVRGLRFSDAGLYRSYVGAGRRRRFIRSVELNVRDHKSSITLAAREQLRLDRYGNQVATVYFQPTGAPEAIVIWEWGRVASRRRRVAGRRIRLTEAETELVLEEVTAEDSGTYRLLDSSGLACSTVQLTVKEAVHEVPVPPGQMAAYNNSPRDVLSRGFRESGAFTVISSLLFFSLYIIN